MASFSLNASGLEHLGPFLVFTIDEFLEHGIIVTAAMRLDRAEALRRHLRDPYWVGRQRKVN